jgi:hypothetical protein
MSTLDALSIQPSGPPRPRICGRCRKGFPGDGTLVETGLQEWWACPSCHDLLLGAGSRPAPWIRKTSGGPR